MAQIMETSAGTFTPCLLLFQPPENYKISFLGWPVGAGIVMLVTQSMALYHENGTSLIQMTVVMETKSWFQLEIFMFFKTLLNSPSLCQLFSLF